MRRELVRAAGSGSVISRVPKYPAGVSAIAIENVRAELISVTLRKRSVRVCIRRTTQASLGQLLGARYSRRTSSIAESAYAFRATVVTKIAATARYLTWSAAPPLSCES